MNTITEISTKLPVVGPAIEVMSTWSEYKEKKEQLRRKSKKLAQIQKGLEKKNAATAVSCGNRVRPVSQEEKQILEEKIGTVKRAASKTEEQLSAAQYQAAWKVGGVVAQEVINSYVPGSGPIVAGGLQSAYTLWNQESGNQKTGNQEEEEDNSQDEQVEETSGATLLIEGSKAATKDYFYSNIADAGISIGQTAVENGCSVM